MKRLHRHPLFVAGATSATLLALAGCEPQQECDEPGTLCTYLGVIDEESGLGVPGLAAEGTCRLEAKTYQAVDMTEGPDGKIYFLDWNNHRIARLEPGAGPDGCDTLKTVTGTTQLGDGPISTTPQPASSAAWNHPTDIVFDDAGALHFAAWHNSRVVALDLDADTCWLVAGTGKRGYTTNDATTGEPLLAPAADFDLPAGLAFHSSGELYIMDQANQLIRKVDLDGYPITIAGLQRQQGYNGDGIPAAEAQIYQEVGQAAFPGGKMDFKGDVLFFADTGNHRIRTIDVSTGMIDTVVGTGTPGFSGDGGDAAAAEINAPRDVEYDPVGDRLFFADTGNSCVRVVDLATNKVSTYAGMCGMPGIEGDHGPATEGMVNNPYGIELASDGTLYIADTFNSLIRTVAPQ